MDLIFFITTEGVDMAVPVGNLVYFCGAEHGVNILISECESEIECKNDFFDVIKNYNKLFDKSNDSDTVESEP